MAEVVYNVGKEKIVTNILPNGATILRACLILTSKTGADDPDRTTMSDIDAQGTVALHGTGPGTPRITLASVTKTTDTANNRIEWDCADFAFPGAAVTALALVIYDATTDTNDGTRIPISFYDTGFGAGIDITGGLNVTIGAEGFLWLS